MAVAYDGVVRSKSKGRSEKEAGSEVGVGLTSVLVLTWERMPKPRWVMGMVVIELHLTPSPERRGTTATMEKMGWSSRRVAALLSPYDVFPSPNLSLSMNIIVWNSMGVLKPNF